MSVYKNRVVRQMYKDIFLPVWCYASKSQFYSLNGFCRCMTECKFSPDKSRRNQDYRNSGLAKGPQSQK